MVSTSIKICAVCGKLLSGRQQLYCCEECRKAAKTLRVQAAYKPTGKPGLYREKICPDCGKPFYGHIKSYRCRECQAAANRKNDAEAKRRKASGKTRQLGSTDFCCRCGKPYTVKAGKQMYCQDCVADANREHHAKRMRDINKRPEIKAAKAQRRKMEPTARVCVVCGTEFCSKAFALTCSQECRIIHLAEYYAAYDASRKQEER